MDKELLTIPQLYAKGREKLRERGISWVYSGGKRGPQVRANREYLDSLYYEPKFFNPSNVDTSLTIFGVDLRTPVFCSAIGRTSYMSKADIIGIAKGVASAGSLIMLGLGGSSELQGAIDTGAPVVKIVKPYQKTDIIYKKVRDAEIRGCVAVGMDIDHFYGVLMSDRVVMTEVFGPQHLCELKQLISQTKLPFIIKGVLSVSDTEKAIQLGASAIVVSNHGSSSLDFSVPSMLALPKIVKSVGNKLTILIDTGFETGNDVFKALAFGAKAIGFASPIIFSYVADGSSGVESLISQVTAELQRTMIATGCPNLSTINRTTIVQMPYIGE